MTAIPARLQQIHAALEGEHFEFKEWKTKDDFDGLTKYACALANEGGGRIVLGVADQRPRGAGSLAKPGPQVQHMGNQCAQCATPPELAQVLPLLKISQTQHLFSLLTREGQAFPAAKGS